MKIKTLICGFFPTLLFNIKAFGFVGALKMKFPIFVGGGGTNRKNIT